MKKSISIILIVCFIFGITLGIVFNLNTHAEKIAEINNLIENYNPNVENAILITETIYNKSNKNNIDRRLVLAIAIQESDFRQNVIGDNEEIGIMQIKPSTGKDMENNNELLNLYEVEDNLIAGIRYLKFCKNLMQGYASNYIELLELTATAYNRGPWRVMSKLENNINPVNNYAEEVLETRRLILAGQLTGGD